MFRYRLYTPDMDELGEATYTQMIRLGEEIHFQAGKRYRVAVVVYEEEDELPFVGLLKVEAGPVGVLQRASHHCAGQVAGHSAGSSTTCRRAP